MPEFDYKGERMKRFFLGLLITFACFTMSSVMHGVPAETVVLSENNDVPELDEQEFSDEDQDLLETVQVEELSAFWQWVNKVGGYVAVRCVRITRYVTRKAKGLNRWWQAL